MSLAHLTQQVILKPKEDRRIAAGHQWVFSNEIRETKGNPERGDVVELLDAGGRPLGIGFYNPHSLIAVRLLSGQIGEINLAFFEQRLSAAHALRSALFPGSAVYRLVHSESDFLPGLIVDRFNDYVVVQSFSYGMERSMPLICDAIERLLAPKGIVERNESSLRDLEGLPQRRGILRGEVGPTVITEHGLRYEVHVLNGQKTGFFLDQRENRALVRRFSNAADVLDCFCNDGGFALNAAAAGAATVLGIDTSADAVNRARRNAALNDLGAAQFREGDVFATLDELHGAGSRFDVVILDPPSFTKSRKNVQMAKKGYADLHARALGVLKQGGVLFTASCSHHILPEVFLDLVQVSARKAGRSLQLLETRGASPDHPVLPVMPETQYLKLYVLRVT